MPRFLICTFALISSFFLSGVGVVRAQNMDEQQNPVIFAGSSSVYFAVFDQMNKHLHADIPFAYDTIVSNSGRGLRALSEGKADVAMISDDLNALIDGLKLDGRVILNKDDYDVHPIYNTKIIFIVHPDNPVSSLSRADLKKIFTGEIKNWSELGVSDLGPIRVVSEHETGGMYNLIVKQLNEGTPIVEDRIRLQNAPQMALVVSQSPSAIGFISNQMPKEHRFSVRELLLDDPLIQQLSFVTSHSRTPAHAHDIVHAIQDAFEGE